MHFFFITNLMSLNYHFHSNLAYPIPQVVIHGSHFVTIKSLPSSSSKRFTTSMTKPKRCCIKLLYPPHSVPKNGANLGPFPSLTPAEKSAWRTQPNYLFIWQFTRAFPVKVLRRPLIHFGEAQSVVLA